MAGMPRVGGGADTACQKHYTGLLRSHVYSACSAFSASEIAFTKSAEAANIAEGQVEGLIAL
jgi:hypothetical protein